MTGRKRLVSPSEFAAFKAKVVDWAARFGLSDWLMTVKLDELPDSTFAQFHADPPAAMFMIDMSDRLPPEHLTDEIIGWFALHEILHLVIHEWRDTVAAAPNLEEGATHRLIHRIMRAMGQPEMDLGPSWPESDEPKSRRASK